MENKTVIITNYRSPSTFPTTSFPLEWGRSLGFRPERRFSCFLAVSATRCIYLHSWVTEPNTYVTLQVRDLTNPAYPLVTTIKVEIFLPTGNLEIARVQFECMFTRFHLFILASTKLHVYNAATCARLYSLNLTGEANGNGLILHANAREDALYITNTYRQLTCVDPFKCRFVEYQQLCHFQEGYWVVIGCDGNERGTDLKGWEKDVVLFVKGRKLY